MEEGKEGQKRSHLFLQCFVRLTLSRTGQNGGKCLQGKYFFVPTLREKTARSQNSQYVFGQPFFFLFQLRFHFGVGNAMVLLSPNGIWRKMGEGEKVFSSFNCVSGPLWSHYMGKAKEERRRNGVRDEQRNFRFVKFEGLLQKVSYV